MDDATALYDRSLAYLGDNGQPADYELAFRLNAQAAALGLPDAILSMGWFYFNGFGTPCDLGSAERWYRRSARLGEPKAMFSLGQIACEEEVFEAARHWFELAHKHGHVRSLYWLGKLHWRGQGVPRDQVKAVKLFEQAARANDPEATRLMRFRNRRRYVPDNGQEK
jgi:TPR repeat protein